MEDLGAESSAITLRPICCGHPLLRLSVIIRLKTLQGKHICLLRMTWSDSTTGYESQSPQFTAIGLHIWTGGNKEAQFHKHPVFIVGAKDHGNEYANYLSIRTSFQAANFFFPRIVLVLALWCSLCSTTTRNSIPLSQMVHRTMTVENPSILHEKKTKNSTI